MPIYEYYCRDNHRIYQFYAKTLAQGRIVPKCPDNPRYRMEKVVSAFAVVKKGKSSDSSADMAADLPPSGKGEDDPRMDAAMAAMESEFANVDENDPRAMGRMMRRMSDLTGEKIDGEMEEVVRKLEEGADPESLDEEMGGDPSGEDRAEPPAGDPQEPRRRFRARRGPPVRDPKLYDYE